MVYFISINSVTLVLFFFFLLLLFLIIIIIFLFFYFVVVEKDKPTVAPQFPFFTNLDKLSLLHVFKLFFPFIWDDSQTTEISWSIKSNQIIKDTVLKQSGLSAELFSGAPFMTSCGAAGYNLALSSACPDSSEQDTMDTHFLC